MKIDLPILTEDLYKGLSEFLLDGKPLDRVAKKNNLEKKDLVDWKNYLSDKVPSLSYDLIIGFHIMIPTDRLPKFPKHLIRNPVIL